MVSLAIVMKLVCRGRAGKRVGKHTQGQLSTVVNLLDPKKTIEIGIVVRAEIGSQIWVPESKDEAMF